MQQHRQRAPFSLCFLLSTLVLLLIASVLINGEGISSKSNLEAVHPTQPECMTSAHVRFQSASGNLGYAVRSSCPITLFESAAVQVTSWIKDASSPDGQPFIVYQYHQAQFRTSAGYFEGTSGERRQINTSEEVKQNTDTFSPCTLMVRSRNDSPFYCFSTWHETTGS